VAIDGKVPAYIHKSRWPGALQARRYLVVRRESRDEFSRLPRSKYASPGAQAVAVRAVNEMNLAESGAWAVAILRVWREDQQLRFEFSCVVDFEFWAHEISESLLRSAFESGKET
jgi:hypothetical protein